MLLRSFTRISRPVHYSSYSASFQRSHLGKFIAQSMSTTKTDPSASTNVATLKLALCQIGVTDNKVQNIETAKKAIEDAVDGGAEMVVLPECWNSPYATTSFPVYAENIPASSSEMTATEHPSTRMLADAAKLHGIYLIGGSIPEKDESGVYNTSIIFDPQGNLITKHRKMHLFDIDVPGKITFKESDTLSAGNQVTTFDTPYGTIGVGICYDIRFPELAMLMRQRGAKVLIYPGAFNLTTGPAHWELLARARAVDCQAFVATASPARGPEGGYQAWGHSTIVTPWGGILATTEENPSIVHAELKLDEAEEMRRNIPTSFQKRNDIYKLIES